MTIRIILVILAAHAAFAGVTYSYDAGGHLVKADYGSAGVVMYTYDGAGNWITRQVQGTAGPDLTITKTHTGTFTQGQTAATYTITASNVGTASTAGAVTVTDTLPFGLTAASVSGSGWSCTQPSGPCTRNDALAAGSGYPPLLLTVNVAGNAPASLINTATVSGGGETNVANDTATDLTTIIPSGGANLTITKTHTGTFTQGQQGAQYTVTVSNAGTVPTSGTVTVTETVPTGLTLASMAGTGWTCARNTCTRSDALAVSSSYAAIFVTVNVASSAASPQVNQVSVSGGGAATASASDATTIGTSQEWVHTWGGTNADTTSSVATDAAGNIYLTGSTSSFGAGDQDVLLLKYSSTGTLLWSRDWGGPANDSGNGVAVDSSGNVYVAGSTDSFGYGSYDALLLKFDSSGNLLWSRTWGGANFDAGYDIAFDASGNVYMAAESYTLGNCAVLLKFDPNGNLLSSHTWKGPATYDSAYSLDVDSSGNVVLVGVSWDYSVSPNHNSILILKFDNQGDFLWNKNLVSGAEDEASGSKVVRFDAGGNIFVAGHRAAVCNNSNFSLCNFDVEIAKLDPNGNLIWDESWGGSGFEAAAGLAFDQSGNLIVTGSTESFLGGTSAAMALRMDSTGSLLQSRVWGGNGSVSGSGAAVDSTGEIVMGGSAPNASGTWQTFPASVGTLSPSLTSPPGTPGGSTGGLQIPNDSPAGVPTGGVTDTGGGGTDALAIKTTLTSGHPAFFTGEASLGSGVYYLQFPDGSLFGYYNYQYFPILYHYDLGFESFIDGGNGAAYLYDFASGHWWYTSASLFPYLYDFTLNTWIYYFPDTKNPGHYTKNPRYFSNLTTGKLFTM